MVKHMQKDTLNEVPFHGFLLSVMDYIGDFRIIRRKTMRAWMDKKGV
jgi:hypothetical protein